MLSCVFEVFVAFMAHSRIKWFKHGLFGTKHNTQHNLVNVIVLKWLTMKTIVICSKLLAKFRFWSYFSIFGIFSLKVVQTLVVWHKTWHTTLYGICYCVEIVGVENNGDILEITCLVALLRFF